MAALPANIRTLTENLYRNHFCVNPTSPALEGHYVPDTLKGEKRVWAISVGQHYRALALMYGVKGGGMRYVWYWIGSHEAYNRRIGK